MLSLVGASNEIGTLVLFLSPFTSRTSLNLFIYLKLVALASEELCSKTLATEELNLEIPGIFSTPLPPPKN